MPRDRRVKLVFAAALGRRLLRARGFSRCWFLLPARARLVGDVAHAIRAEFGLAGAPSVELRLEGLLLLPTHDARILRDHDELLVQSAPASALEPGNESDDHERRKAKKLRKQKRDDGRRSRRKQVALKCLSSSSESESSSSSSSSISNSSSSSSSSESDSSSSSESESERPAAVVKATRKKRAEEEEEQQRKRKRQRIDASLLAPAPTKTKCASAKTTSSAGEGDKSGAEPKQRRRRRQRGRKPRDGGAKEASAPPPAPPAPAADAEQQSAPREQLPEAATRGHVRFGVSGEPQADSSGGAGARHARQQRVFVPPELQKYGPSPSASAPAEQQQHHHDPSATRQLRDADEQPRRLHYPHHQTRQEQQQQHQAPARPPNASAAAPDLRTNAKKAKAKFGTMWKRPYEIVATILDGAPLTAAPRTDTSDLLAKFPAPSNSSVSADAFQAGDVVAYKTLTLCMETWQPIASEWLCGAVRSVSGDQVELLPMALSVKEDDAEDSLHWAPKQPAKGHPDAAVVVRTGEVSDVRYLEGPSYGKLCASSQPPQ